eukprot:5121990-Karenia_brevis.AAC.1
MLYVMNCTLLLPLAILVPSWSPLVSSPHISRSAPPISLLWRPSRVAWRRLILGVASPDAAGAGADCTHTM